MKTLIFAADHGGFELKNHLLIWAGESLNADTLEDAGPFEFDASDDYPEFALPAVQSLLSQEQGVDQNPEVFGIFLCRSGAGIAMVANRFAGVRAAVCDTPDKAAHARAHDNANVLVLPADQLSAESAREIVLAFLQTRFLGGAHARRLQQFAHLGELATVERQKGEA